MTTSLPDRGIEFGRFVADLERVPAIDGHSWNELLAYSVQQLLEVEKMLAYDVTRVRTQKESFQDPQQRANRFPDLANYEAWNRRAGMALNVKNQQLSAIKAIKRHRAGDFVRKVSEKHDIRMLLHMARMFHRYMQMDDDTDQHVLDEAFDEVVKAYKRISPETLEFSRPFTGDAAAPSQPGAPATR